MSCNEQFTVIFISRKQVGILLWDIKNYTNKLQVFENRVLKLIKKCRKSEFG